MSQCELCFSELTKCPECGVWICDCTMCSCEVTRKKQGGPDEED